jgi:hypothetical protein
MQKVEGSSPFSRFFPLNHALLRTLEGARISTVPASLLSASRGVDGAGPSSVRVMGPIYPRPATGIVRWCARAVTSAAAHLNPLCYKRHRTRYRGVYRSAGRYVVPYIDTLGAERLRDFESLAEARNFRAACRIAEKLGNRSQPNIGRSGESRRL